MERTKSVQNGCIRLNEAAGTPPSDNTIIVSGPSRSGTSLIAAALCGARVWLGDALDNACFEDVHIAYMMEKKNSWLARPQQAARHPTSWKFALKGAPVADLVSLIAQRNEAHEQWGFKRPNILSRLGPGGLALFRHPRAVICFRDPVAMAHRTAVAEGVPFARALNNARRLLDENLRAAATLTCPVLLVSFEKAATDRDAFLRELFDFCGVPVACEQTPRINQFVDEAGGEYKRLTASPVAGYIDSHGAPALTGWCHRPQNTEPDSVDIYADGVKLATILADRERADLRISSFRSTRHGFELDLTPYNLCSDVIIDARVAGTDIRLEGGGFTLHTHIERSPGKQIDSFELNNDHDEGRRLHRPTLKPIGVSA
ncbi:hypothetical protein [Beijerinckia sp. L45]|uniref:hypothetical protein n=1 Tax=Beijerinckia sp. L45 TaxID=1641855 RepID=UPI00131CD235|nr:hypothetical protein [Beijerinckia sp. L45]